MAQLARLLKWNEDQPRAENGQFGSGGGGSDRMYVEGASRNAGGGARAEVPKAIQGFYEQLKDEKDGGAARLQAGLKRMRDGQLLSLSDQASGLVGAGKFKAFADALNSAIRVEYNTRANTAQFQAAIRATRKVDLGRLLKWNPDQERDERGRFGGGGDLKAMFADSLGMARANMPQIPNGALKEKFIAEQAARGVRTEAESVPATALKPTQADFNPENIQYLRDAVKAGTFKDTNPLVVSREGRVLDGHHRWAGAALDGEKLSVLRVDLPIHELLDQAKAFNDRSGVAPRTATDKLRPMKFDQAIELMKTYVPPRGLALLKAWDADQERDEMGRWTAGGGGGGREAQPRAQLIARAPEAPKMPTLVAKPTAAVNPPMSEMTAASVLPADVMAEAQSVISEYHVPGAEPSSGLTKEQEAQATRELAPKISAAHEVKPAYDAKLREIASKLGGEAKTAPVKGGARLLEKHVLENGGQTELMRDLVRGSIVVKSVDDVPAAIEAVRAAFPLVEGRLKNRFEKPLSTGYRDVLMNVHLPGGLQGEVQIHIPEMIAAKSVGHKVYDVSRSMAGGASNPEYTRLEGLQSKIYGSALDANLKRTGRGP